QVFLEVELQQRVGMWRVFGQEIAEVLEQQDPVGQGRAIIAAQVEPAERLGTGIPHETRTGGFAVKALVVEHGAAMVGMDDQVDLDAGPEPHGFENALGREDWIGALAAASMPCEPGAVAAAVDMEGIAHAALWWISASSR